MEKMADEIHIGHKAAAPISMLTATRIALCMAETLLAALKPHIPGLAEDQVTKAAIDAVKTAYKTTSNVDFIKKLQSPTVK